ncbi:BolA/IbaG family iron-sulfur metabolism protein [Catenovulum sp. 2E275]|uniref:BolA family protein n=1 Tax=Catenovulum sp. 2E275 TaxID=2980497 RepID=UPI0021D36501|nr:BolA/IbaG family iron-sulfur metabolism protein [Catenovulum sp. 2E275]MCU4674910.1 BolA/IbaG family iron-sulfur metabolism protein [Catenovulum sp. 2E275]
MNITHQTIISKLKQDLAPVVLDVQNESHMHSGPAQDSHFKVIIVSDEFNDKRLIARHRMVNACLADELAGAVHALAIHTYTQDEWQTEQHNVPVSPNCMGGSKTNNI